MEATNKAYGYAQYGFGEDGPFRWRFEGSVEKKGSTGSLNGSVWRPDAAA